MCVHFSLQSLLLAYVHTIILKTLSQVVRSSSLPPCTCLLAELFCYAKQFLTRTMIMYIVTVANKNSAFGGVFSELSPQSMAIYKLRVRLGHPVVGPYEKSISTSPYSSKLMIGEVLSSYFISTDDIICINYSIPTPRTTVMLTSRGFILVAQ